MTLHHRCSGLESGLSITAQGFVFSQEHTGGVNLLNSQKSFLCICGTQGRLHLQDQQEMESWFLLLLLFLYFYLMLSLDHLNCLYTVCVNN